MGILDRLRTGWALTKDSVQVLREEPSLVAFPTAAGIAGAFYILLTIGGTTLLSRTITAPTVFFLAAIAYLASAVTASFFAGAMVWNAREVFRGEDPTIKKGLAAAWRNKWPLFAWGIIAAIVGLGLRLMERSDNLVAQIAAYLFSVAWGILTYFVVPVVVFEDTSVRGMFERSGALFKDTWGETIGAGFGVGIITLLFTMTGLAGAVIVYLIFSGSIIGILGGISIGGIVLLVAVLGGTTLAGVAKTALYVFATEGIQPNQFDDVDFSEALEQ